MTTISKWMLITVIAIVFLPILFIWTPVLFTLSVLTGIIILKLKFPMIKGAVAEWRVNRILSALGPNYSIYHDLYVPNGDRGTAQVDHVVTSPYGIFVIETKHFQGWIFGKEDQRYWTQVIYKRKEKMFNPIWQNYGHVQALKNYIGNEDSAYFQSIIAFSSQSTLKFEDRFKSARVIQFPQLIQVIKEWNIYRISDFELREINRKLEGILIEDKKVKKIIRKQHVQTIQTNRKEKVRKEKESIQRNTCPKCKSELSLKTGKYGDFYGCSSFPKCRFTREVS
ncbi:NERD domain-containing protein [Sporosarcina sp. YIM B06819]|uniref:NERD domain-containing protein n=1 Tax=Sporosarcina sp. YIM B06819 TaxID=3081769 RepID=UPI00298D0135|nr:NERD domain-containing protein [Sporosarcina sp. YIM B06819]